MTDFRQIVIAQNENYLAFPDVALAADGSLICAYFEGDKHSPTWSNLVLKQSVDGGESWSAPAIAGKSSMKQEGFCWNCPRISLLPDGRLFLICDWEDGSKRRATWRWYSSDNGKTWSQPKQILSEGLCPDRVIPLPSGRLLTTVCCDESYRPSGIAVPTQDGDRQILFCSDDGGEVWRPYSVIWAENEMEGGLVALNDTDLVCYFTNLKWTSDKAVSRDGGTTWQRSRIPFSATRPCPGVVTSGNILVTFGIRGGGAFASLETPESSLCIDPSEQKCAVLKLADAGAAPWWDYGYSAWTQLPDGRIFCVYYARESPKYWPHIAPTRIEGVWFSESDFAPLTQQ
jgi:hypothetical protein